MTVHLRDVLDEMGIGAVSVRSLKAAPNRHWLVRTADGLVVLRRYQSRRRFAYLEWESRLMQGLARAGWPVSSQVARPIEAGGHVWWAFTHLPGRSPSPRSPSGRRAEQRHRGRLLARLHRDLAGTSDLGQREGWVRAEEVFHQRDGGVSLDEALSSLARRRPDEAEVLRRHAERARSRLEELGASGLPAIAIHGDFAPWNLRFRHGRLSGILDFDLSHLNHRVADFALSWRGRDDEVIHGYHEVEPLSDQEWELITPVWWTWCLAGARDQLSRDPDPDLTWVLSHITRRSELTDRVAF
jgi:Ser/Thr protein kinase RdoA (MazF antagonist)